MGQLALACAEGGMEWLYPVGVLRLTLGSSDSARGFASPACGRRGPLLESRSSLRGRAASWSCCWLRTRAQPGVDACAGVPASAGPSSCRPLRTSTSAAVWPPSASSCKRTGVRSCLRRLTVWARMVSDGLGGEEWESLNSLPTRAGWNMPVVPTTQGETGRFSEATQLVSSSSAGTGQREGGQSPVIHFRERAGRGQNGRKGWPNWATPGSGPEGAGDGEVDQNLGPTRSSTLWPRLSGDLAPLPQPKATKVQCEPVTMETPLPPGKAARPTHCFPRAYKPDPIGGEGSLCSASWLQGRHSRAHYTLLLPPTPQAGPGGSSGGHRGYPIRVPEQAQGH